MVFLYIFCGESRRGDIADCMSRNSQPSQEGDEACAPPAAMCHMVQMVEALVTELTPGDCGDAPTFRAEEFIGDEPVIARVPALYMVEFSLIG